MNSAQVHAGRVVANALQLMKSLAIGGEFNTLALNDAAEQYLSEHDVYPSCKGYKPKFNSRTYQHGTCISINHEIGHGVPADNKILKPGDIVTFDIVGEHQGWHVDSAITVCIGEPSEQVQKLISATQHALELGIQQAVTGNCVGDITNAISSVADEYELGVVIGMIGHGIGKSIHEEPNIPNTGRWDDFKLKEGMTICIEPMFTLGSGHNLLMQDGWTIATIDKSWAAHFEHTVCVGEKPLILTMPSNDVV